MQKKTTSFTSASLIRRAGDFEPEAWQRLSRLYSPMVYRWCRQAGLQDSDAADVMQEVFRGVANGIGRFVDAENRGSFRGWLWGITRNKVADHFRRLAQQPHAEGGTAGYERILAVSDTLPDEATDADGFDSELALLHRALGLIRGEFEDRTWQAFGRSAIGNEKTSEIAADLGMTNKAVRQAKYRVIRRLRAELE